MQTILVPLDGSACAEQVLPYVQMLAQLLNARVHLLLVLTDVEREGIITGGGVSRRGADGTVASYQEIAQRAWETLEQQAEIYLTAQVELLRTGALEIDTEVRQGIPHECIVQAAAIEPDTIIAMTTHGYGGLQRWAFGSIADKVIQLATVPVLVVRSSAGEVVRNPALRRIMVPFDGSDLARCALPHAVAMARSARAELVVLQAIAPRTEYPDLLLMQRNQAVQALRTLATELRQQQVKVVPIVAVDHTDAAEAIAAEAERREVDLIVMATHGYGGWQRWMIGSVADKVLHAALTPILLVRAPMREL